MNDVPHSAQNFAVAELAEAPQLGHLVCAIDVRIVKRMKGEEGEGGG